MLVFSPPGAVRSWKPFTTVAHEVLLPHLLGSRHPHSERPGGSLDALLDQGVWWGLEGGGAVGPGCWYTPPGRTRRRGANGFTHLSLPMQWVFFASSWLVGWGFPPAQPPCRQQTQTTSCQPPPWCWCRMKGRWEPSMGRGAAKTTFPPKNQHPPGTGPGHAAASRSSPTTYL